MKATKAVAHYRDRPNDSQHCSRCTMFEPPDLCSSVAGLIKPYGWCIYFKAKQAKRWTQSASASEPRATKRT